jgi:hypothetical protein
VPVEAAASPVAIEAFALATEWVRSACLQLGYQALQDIQFLRVSLERSLRLAFGRCPSGGGPDWSIGFTS